MKSSHVARALTKAAAWLDDEPLADVVAVAMDGDEIEIEITEESFAKVFLDSPEPVPAAGKLPAIKCVRIPGANWKAPGVSVMCVVTTDGP